MREQLGLSEKAVALGEKAERDCAPYFERIDRVAFEITARVLAAFRTHRVSDTLFAGTTGYGYDDRGRDTLEEIYADVLGAEAALVRIGFVNGTHAIACALFSAVRSGDAVLSATGSVYDTLQTVVGLGEEKRGTFADYNIEYRETPLSAQGQPDYAAIGRDAADPKIKAVFIQRSKGYAVRETLSCEEIEMIVKTVRAVNPSAAIIVDNCYGEFVQTREPCMAGADLVAGSLIKNPGGGLAPTGGYIAGRRDLVEAAAYRLTVPGIGGECGTSLGQNRLLYQGFFMAPHIVAQALKTAVFCARVMELLGYDVSPRYDAVRHDIIQMIHFGAPEPLLQFCRGIQSGAPVDSFVTPEPWDMPGYDAQVVMAAGAFIQGASIELSADAPMRAPYTAYMQGGITYESGKLGILLAAQALMGERA